MPWIFGGREARRREQKHECLALLLLSLSLSDADTGMDQSLEKEGGLGI